MPFDTLARVSLRIISNKSEIRLDDGTMLPAINWLADVLAQPEKGRSYKIFRIDHPDILALLNLDGNRKLFSFDELTPGLPKVDEQMQRINQLNKKEWDIYQRKMNDLYSHRCCSGTSRTGPICTSPRPRNRMRIGKRMKTR